jgi:L-threonylcarbamoyladenylate synthase|tara:strand:- start:391 stop:951 length:561 start_codon:yes stop_codon:yes gene_type:complete
LFKKSFDVSESIDWLNDGKILVHPTEGVWGLGCNALDQKAFKKIYLLKKRDSQKSFILLASSYEAIKKYIIKLTDDDISFLRKSWPGPVTLLIKFNNDLPSHLKNHTGKIAIRVSNHLPLKSLFKGFEGLMVSTSANVSGEEIINDPIEIINAFDDIDVAYYNESLGTNKKPSTIIDLASRKIIRK